MPNVYFLQGDPVTDEQMAQKTSIQGALYLSNDISGNSNSNRLYIGRTNATGGIKSIVTPTPFKQIIQFNGATKSSFDGTAEVTTNIQAVSLVSSTNNALARFDGTGGFIKNSTVTLDDNGNINTPGILRGSTYEAYLLWGGKNFTGSYGPIDAAMVPQLGANRLAFMPAAGVEIQYSIDGGSTWSNYPTSDANKINLFNGNTSSYTIGASTNTGIDKSNYQLRIIITSNIANVYTQLNKFVILCSTNGSSGSWCTIDAKTKSNVDAGNDTWVSFANQVSISGWSGYNIINTSNITTYANNNSQYQKLRFTFGVTSHSSSSSYSGLQILSIMGFGGVGWTTPSTMARTGRMYTYDENQNVRFPARVTAQAFTGNLNGNADSASKLTTTSAGSATQPIYFSNGIPVASNITVGGDLKPTYLKAGVITEVTNTMAALEVDQIFSGTNTFNKQITASGGINVLGRASIDTNGYVTGTWLRTTASTRTTAAATEICIKRDGWIYTRTPSEILADMGVTASATELNILDGATITINENTITGNLNGNAVSATNATNSSKLYVNTTSADTNYYILGATGTGNQSVYRALNSSGTANTTGVYFNGVTGVLFGAAWNDYAEFRQSNELEAGRVVCETGKGDLILSTERLQPGAEIISDTFGFAIGETNKCKTPIAASGRVLAYTFEDRYEFKAGDAVCAAPGGTVSKMTRDEIINYPDRIIGTVSEIPEYDTWGQSNIKVNNRIWIRIR